jgi:hypothetical protein
MNKTRQRQAPFALTRQAGPWRGAVVAEAEVEATLDAVAVEELERWIELQQEEDVR